MTQGHKKLPASFPILGNSPSHPYVNFILASSSVTVLHKHESKHGVLPWDSLSFNKGNGRNNKKKAEGDAEWLSWWIRWPYYGMVEGVCCKIFRQWNTIRAVTLALLLAALCFIHICVKGKITYSCTLFWCRKKEWQQKGRIHTVRHKHRHCVCVWVCVGWISPWANRGSTHIG